MRTADGRSFAVVAMNALWYYELGTAWLGAVCTSAGGAAAGFTLLVTRRMLPTVRRPCPEQGRTSLRLSPRLASRAPASRRLACFGAADGDRREPKASRIIARAAPSLLCRALHALRRRAGGGRGAQGVCASNRHDDCPRKPLPRPRARTHAHARTLTRSHVRTRPHTRARALAPARASAHARAH